MNTHARITARRAIFDRQDHECPLLGLYEPQRRERDLTHWVVACVSALCAAVVMLGFYASIHREVLRPLAVILAKVTQ